MNMFFLEFELETCLNNAASVLVELLSNEPSDEELKLGPESIENPVSNSYSSVIAGIKTRGKANK